jgi:BirA family biotin operon repressor/biotin-[acetyl-CoA-carboxylase] ligase
MAASLELLDRSLILSRMAPLIRERLNGLQIESSIDSTNSALQRMPLEGQHCTAILAEQQEAGRGRRGKHWHSPFGRNLYLSLGWRFERPTSELGCLSLLSALSATRALSRAGLEEHGIKWPNDILLHGQKLCGCLVEVQGDARKSCHAVLGVGINVHMPASEADIAIDQPWTDLESHLPNCSRNNLAALLLEEMISHLTLFSDEGFAPFREDWQRYDLLKGRKVDALAGTGVLSGVAAGIDGNGALLLDTGDEVLILHSAEVSLKTGLSQ